MTKRLRKIIILPAVGIILALVAFISVYMINSTTRFSADISQNSARVASRGIRAYVGEFEQRSAVVSYTLANDSRLIQIMLDGGNHGELLDHLNNTKEIFGIDFYVVIDAEGRVLARTHYPERYGDIGPQNPAFITSRDEGRAVSTYYSSPTTPMAHSTTGPMFYNDEFIGVVITNLFISDPAFINTMSEIFDAELTFYFEDRAVASTFLYLGGEEYVFADEDVVAAVIGNRESFDSQATINGVNYSAYYFPLVSSEGEVVGMVSAAFSSAYADLLGDALLRGVFLIGLVSAFVAIVIFTATVSRISRPIIESVEREREAQRFNQILLDSAPLSINIWNSKTELVSTSRQSVELFEVADEKEYLDKFYELSPKFQPCGTSSSVKSADYIKKAFRDGYARFEWMHQTKNGQPLPMDVILVRFKHFNEDMLVTYAFDIRPVIAANEKFKMLFEIAPIALEIWDEDGNIIDCNEYVKTLFGLEHKWDFIERYEELSPEFQPCGTPSLVKARTLADQALSDGSVRFEWLHLDENGDELPVTTTFVSYMDQDKPLVVGFNLDLRHIRKALEKEREAELAARESVAKTQFLAKISHEIRTPMNAVLGITEIQMQNESLPEELKDSLSRIRSSSYLLLGIINDLLDLSKVEAGRMEIINKPYEVISLIVDTVQINLLYMGSKRVELLIRVDPNLPYSIIGDELRLKQIINNILSNALKYTDEGTVTLSLDCLRDESDSPDDITLLIRVKDTGKGMTRMQLQRLLSEEYVRFNEDDSIEGSGLGMAITNRLVGLMNGKIEVRSELGLGTLVRLYIPQKSAGNNVIGDEYAEKLQNFEFSQMARSQVATFIRELMPYGRVLVVDDVEVNLYVAKGHLAPYELNVDTVFSGFAAIEKINSGEVYDIIFMDHMMPQMDGIEAVSIIREIGYKGVIIALTANALVGNNEMFIQNGFDGFISKPIDVRELNQLLNEFVSGRHPKEAKKYRSSVQIEAAKFPDASEETSLGMLRVFCRDAQQTIVVLREAVAAGDASLFTISVHAIKSALMYIGEDKLSQEAARLEDVGKTGDMEYISLHFDQFIQELEALSHRIQSQNFQINEDSDIVEDSVCLTKQLQGAKTACESFDIRTALSILDKLLNQTWKKETSDKLQRIHDALFLDSDFDVAVALINECLDW